MDPMDGVLQGMAMSSMRPPSTPGEQQLAYHQYPQSAGPSHMFSSLQLNQPLHTPQHPSMQRSSFTLPPVTWYQLRPPQYNAFSPASSPTTTLNPSTLEYSALPPLPSMLLPPPPATAPFCPFPEGGIKKEYLIREMTTV
jgi:hypothetical protein